MILVSFVAATQERSVNVSRRQAHSFAHFPGRELRALHHPASGSLAEKGLVGPFVHSLTLFGQCCDHPSDTEARRNDHYCRLLHAIVLISITTQSSPALVLGIALLLFVGY